MVYVELAKYEPKSCAHECSHVLGFSIHPAKNFDSCAHDQLYSSHFARSTQTAVLHVLSDQ